LCFFKRVRLEIPLHGEHLGHAVGDGCAGGEHHAAAAVERLDVPHLQEHIEGPLADAVCGSPAMRVILET
jgi:hypothetical protein